MTCSKIVATGISATNKLQEMETNRLLYVETQ